MQKFTVKIRNGLCNRIAGLICCLDYTRKNNQIFQLIWNNDCHCPCKFTDLFENHKGIKLVDNVKPDIVSKGCDIIRGFQKYTDDIINYSEDNLRLSKVWCTLQWSDKTKKEFSSILKELKFKESILKRVSVSANTIGFHIRKTDNHFKVIGEERWFDKKIKENIKKNKKIFIASDDPSVIAKYKKVYNNNIYVNNLNWRNDLPKIGSKFRRLTSVEDAAVDLLSLSRCEKVYGSYNSSFSWLSSMFNMIPYEYKEVKWYSPTTILKPIRIISYKIKKKSRLYDKFVNFVKENV